MVKSNFSLLELNKDIYFWPENKTFCRTEAVIFLDITPSCSSGWVHVWWWMCSDGAVIFSCSFAQWSASYLSKSNSACSEEEIFYSEGTETMEEDVQRGCRCPISGNFQGQAWAEL